jgi:hypothetical protein
MSFFCDHEWSQSTSRFHNPFPFGTSYYVSQHKCQKCGKVEDCNQSGGGRMTNSSGYVYRCTKCDGED